MRKLLPWVLLGVLGVGIAVAAAVGQVQSPGVTSADWLSNLMATTAAAGSAHLRIATVSRSANPAQRSSSVATGVIDFTTGNFRFVQAIHDITYTSTNGGSPHPVPYDWSETAVAIGQSLYEKDAVTVAGTSTVVPSTWNKFINPRNVRQAFGLDSGTVAENAVSGLSGIAPVTSMRSLGPATVNGVSTTRYVVTYGSPVLCAPGAPILSLRQSGSVGSAVRSAHSYEPAIKPVTVWVDGQGRLVQVRESSFSSAQILKALSSSFTASQTSVTTLTFSDFGVPVHIVAPDFTGPPPRNFDVGGKDSNGCVH